MKKEQKNLNEIRQNISNYTQQMLEVNSAIQAETEKHSSLEEQIKNYSDLNNEAGYLKLKKDIRDVEDRLEFLEMKKEALSLNESTLESDRTKFRQELNRINSSGKDKIIAKTHELIAIMNDIKADYSELNELMDSWCVTYNQPLNIQRGILSDTTGTLSTLDIFIKNMNNKMNK